MDEAEIRIAERSIQSPIASLDPEPFPPTRALVRRSTKTDPQRALPVPLDAGNHGPKSATKQSCDVVSPVAPFGAIGTSETPGPAEVEKGQLHGLNRPTEGRVRPTFEDVLQEAEQPRDVATSGWRALLKLPPGRSERERRADLDTIRRSDLDGPRTVVVVNVKGGVGKTTTTRHLAAAIGSAKGGYTIAIDANPSRGNLANRCKPADHKKTVIDLLDDIERFQRADARVGELATYVRPQDELFDVLSSDQDTERMQTLGLAEFAELDAVTDKFYRIKIVDTGNDFRHVAYQAALDVAQGLVIACEIAEDAFEGASWTVDALRDNGHEQLVDNGVAVLIRTSPRRFRGLEKRMLGYFAAHCREVVVAPYDPHQVGGKRILQTRLLPPTVRAAEKAAAAVLRGLPPTLG
jgi:MinD-like ATPase involved in chromosome partitioning or flagellar assembly